MIATGDAVEDSTGEVREGDANAGDKDRGSADNDARVNVDDSDAEECPCACFRQNND